MAVPALALEKIDIEAERKLILESLRSGDFTLQREACERLSALADNHFPDFLPASVTLISDANRLNDRIRERVISTSDQGVEIRQLIEGTVNLLNKMIATSPVGRIQFDQIPENERAIGEKRAAQLTEDIASKLRPGQPEQEAQDHTDDEAAIVRFIVQTQDPKTQGKLIAAQDITKTYNSSLFKLRPISLELNRGEILGIVGVNASGKTTLLRILLGDIKPSNGELSYRSFQEDGKKRDWIAIKRRMAYVSQTLPRWPGRVYDNLCYVASIYQHPLSEISIYLDLLLKRYGLDKFKDATWDELSGGYKTRFEIVRALVSKPDVIVLDEPLAYLDIISQQVVLRQLNQLAKNCARPIGIIITSQQLYEIEFDCRSATRAGRWQYAIFGPQGRFVQFD